MPSTRQVTKDKLDSMETKLQSIEITAIEIGTKYQESDTELSGVMYVISEMIEVVLPLLRKVNIEL